MVTFISSIEARVSRLTSGKRLEQKFDNAVATVERLTCSLAQRKRPHHMRKKSNEYQPGADAIHVITMKVSKGLEFPVVTLPGVGHMPAPGEDEKEAARVFYVAATRATQRLVMGVCGVSNFSTRLSGREVENLGD